MNVTLTPEQRQLADAAARVAADHALKTFTRAEVKAASEEAWSALARAGLTTLRVPEARGGMGAGAVETCLVAEALAARLVPAPFLGATLAADLLTRAGADSTVDRLVASAGVRFAVVLDDRLVALSDAGLALDAVGAEAAVSTAPDGAVALRGITGAADGADLTRDLRVVPRGPEGDSVGVVSGDGRAAWTAFALAAICADMVGVMSATLALAVEHAKTRQQYGRPIGSFQAVQHLVAEALVDVESARSAMWHAAWAVDTLAIDAALAAARMAKAYCATVGPRVCETAVQVWGGMGMTWDCPAHVYLRRGWLDRMLLGDEERHYASLAGAEAGA